MHAHEWGALYLLLFSRRKNVFVQDRRFEFSIENKRPSLKACCQTVCTHWTQNQDMHSSQAGSCPIGIVNTVKSYNAVGKEPFAFKTLHVITLYFTNSVKRWLLIFHFMF